jgi:exodeoxyribonuclease X
MSEAFVVVDLESTNREPKDAHIVEWAALVIVPPWFSEEGLVQEHGGLVKPPVPIPAETSAVHHIIDADVANAPTWEKEQFKLGALFGPLGRIAVAHNAEYERTLLEKEGPVVAGLPLPWLCTYKAALRVWPDAPGHSNEVLRYFLGLGTGRLERQAAHSAMHDARVTAQILGELLRAGTSIEDMLKWTTEPAMLPTCPIGVWRGKKWEDVDHGFLDWILYKARDMREDIKFCAKAEISRREKARAAARPATVSADDEDGVPF